MEQSNSVYPLGAHELKPDFTKPAWCSDDSVAGSAYPFDGVCVP